MSFPTHKPLSKFGAWMAGAGCLAAASLSLHADVAFLGVSAGDATSSDAVLWTRAVDTNAPSVTALTAEVTTDPAFGLGISSYPTSTDASKDYTAKVVAGGLTPGTRYYYRFVAGSVVSITGVFKTAPDAGTAAPIHFAFSGDVDGLMRPYALTRNFDTLNLDFFVFLGDLIYETASSGSPAVTSTASASQANLSADFSRKYREQFFPVNAGGQNGLQTFFASQGNYSLYDNHELGNKQYINGGAPAGGAVGGMSSGAGVDATNPTFDTNAAGPFMNKSTGFQTVQQTFLDFEPVKDRGMINTSGADPRSDGTPQLYYAQPWGRNAVFINVDDRSYRDIRMKTGGGADDTGSRASNPQRTMLGVTQLAWLEQSLLTAQNNGTPWKFVAVSSPIDQIGPIGGSLANVTNGGNTGYAPVASDGGKSWMGQYRAERNALFKFIADNRIYNVVFLTTDDHQNRVNELTYSTNGQTEVQSTYGRVPHCFEIVDGPLAATGPDFVTNHTFANNKLIADGIANAQSAAGIDPVGLDPNYPGLHNVTRENDPIADELRQPVDFYSPDTFNYNTLDIGADGRTLTVKSFGINSTAQNSFLEYNPTANPVRELFSFQVDAASPLSGIDHIILVYQENWSFDSLYGRFPGANGIANASSVATNQLDRLTGNPLASLAGYDPVSHSFPVQNPPVPLNSSTVQDPRFLLNPADTNGPLLNGLDTRLPFNLNSYLQPTDISGDIVHRYWQEQFQIDHGAMDKFVTWSDNPGLVMSYFDATPLPEGRLAQQYVLCDNFFHSAFGGSFLNHQFLVAAQAPTYPNAAAIVPNNLALLDGNGVLQLNGGGLLVRDGNVTPIGGVCFQNPAKTFDKNYAVNTIFSTNLAASGSPSSSALLPSQNDSDPLDPVRPYIPTIGDRMDAAGVSWKWYSGGWDRALNVSPSNPAHYGTTVPDSSISLFQWHHQAFAFYDNYAPWTNGVRNPRSAAHLQDETNFFQDVANDTLPQVVFIKPLGPDNEHPGYASLLQGQMHVSNIVAAVQANPALWAHTVIIVTYDEHGGRWDHVTPPVRDIWGPGSRVPGLIISPLARAGYIDHTQYETLSFLRTVEQRFGLMPLTAADANAATFAPALDPGLSSNEEPAGPPTVSVATVAGQLTLSWPAGYGGFLLQAQTNSAGGLTATNWTTIATVTSNSFNATIDPAQSSVFYRIVKP